MNAEIRMKHGNVKKLAEAIGCSRIHAKNCLNGVVESELAERIRKKALEMGGVIVRQKEAV